MAGQEGFHAQFRADVERIRFEYLRTATRGDLQRLRFRATLYAIGACTSAILFAFVTFLLLAHRIPDGRKIWAIAWLVISALATNASYFWCRWNRSCLSRAVAGTEQVKQEIRGS